MWCVPFLFFCNNYLAVGIIPQDEHDATSFWANKMYYGKGPSLPFVRGKFSKSARRIEYWDDEIRVMGNMGTSYKTHIKIQVLPNKMTEL